MSKDKDKVLEDSLAAFNQLEQELQKKPTDYILLGNTCVATLTVARNCTANEGYAMACEYFMKAAEFANRAGRNDVEDRAYTDAFNSWDQANKRNPNDAMVNQLYVTLVVSKGNALLARKDFKGASECFAAALGKSGRSDKKVVKNIERKYGEAYLRQYIQQQNYAQNTAKEAIGWRLLRTLNGEKIEFDKDQKEIFKNDPDLKKIKAEIEKLAPDKKELEKMHRRREEKESFLQNPEKFPLQHQANPTQEKKTSSEDKEKPHGPGK